MTIIGVGSICVGWTHVRVAVPSTHAHSYLQRTVISHVLRECHAQIMMHELSGFPNSINPLYVCVCVSVHDGGLALTFVISEQQHVYD